MTTSTPASTDRAAFTLLEFLGVIAVMLILAAILAPAVLKTTGAARRSRAGIEMQAIAQGLKAYRSAFGAWPGQVGGDADGWYNGARHWQLLAALTNAPGGRSFIDLSDSTVSGGEWLDPWGQPYEIALDEDNDGAVNVSDSPFTNVADTVAILSRGPDPSVRDKWVLSWTR